MSVLKTIVLAEIAEYLKKDNSVLSKCVIDDAYAKNSRVYIPNAGAPGTVTRNATYGSFLDASARTDATVDYYLIPYHVGPIVIPKLTAEFLSYDKNASVAIDNVAALMDSVADWTIYNWFNGASTGTTGTLTMTGTVRSAKAPYQTGTRSGLTYKDVLKAGELLTYYNVPEEGRILLVDPFLASDLFLDSQFHYAPELANQIGMKGAIGTVGNFVVVKRSTTARYTSGGTLLDPSTANAATQCLGALAYHPNMVRRAISDTFAFISNDNPNYLGDVLSFGLNAGAGVTRADKYGVVALKEGI